MAQSVLSGMREACAASYHASAKNKMLHGHLYIHCVKSYTNVLILSGMTWEAETILREVRCVLIVHICHVYSINTSATHHTICILTVF